MPAKKKLSEKADKRYRAKITVPETGQKIYISARTRAELEQKKARVRAELIEGVAMHDMPFVKAVEEWFNVVKRPKIKAQSTLKNWLNALNLHVLPYFDARKMCRAVRRADLQQCLDHLSGANTTTIQPGKTAPEQCFQSGFSWLDGISQPYHPVRPGLADRFSRSCTPSPWAVPRPVHARRHVLQAGSP